MTLKIENFNLDIILFGLLTGGLLFILGFLIAWVSFAVGIDNELLQALPTNITKYTMPMELEASITAEAWTLGAWYSFFVMSWLSSIYVLVFVLWAIGSSIKKV